jgi:hypothetical protein
MPNHSSQNKLLRRAGQPRIPAEVWGLMPVRQGSKPASGSPSGWPTRNTE